MEIKMRLLQVGKKQVDLIHELRKRGYTGIEAPLVSSVISGRNSYPKGLEIREAIGDILSEWEAECCNREV